MSVLKHLNKNLLKFDSYQPGKPVEEVARELGLNPEEIVKLASNENPLGPSPKAVRAMKKHAGEMHYYPEGNAYYLRNRLAEEFEVDPDFLIFGNGSNELLELIGHCFLSPETSAVMSAHAFVVYKLVTKMFGADVIEFPMSGLTHDLNAMSKGVPENTSVIFVCNPNNPTSSMVNEAQIDALMAHAPEDALVVFDEAYAEIALKKMPDTMKYVREGKNVIILRTFSKAYGLAGLRVGFGIAKPEIIRALERPRQPFNVNRMAQLAACAALDDKAFVKKSRKVFREGAELLSNFCKGVGLQHEPPHANFMLIKVGDGAKVFNELQKRGVIVRPMAPYQLPEWIRVSFGTEEENGKFISEMTDLLQTNEINGDK